MAVQTIDEKISNLLIQIGTDIVSNGQNKITGPMLQDILNKITNLLNSKIGNLTVVGYQGVETVADILALLKQSIDGGGLTRAYNTFYKLNDNGTIPGYIPLNATVYDPTDKRMKVRSSTGLINPSVPSVNILYIESQFKELYYWDGNDLISIAGALSGADNRFLYMKLYSNNYPTYDVAASLINGQPSFSVAEDQILVVKIIYGQEKFNPTAYVFTLKDLGKGNYGLAGTSLTADTVEMIALSKVTPEDLTALATTQLVDLGEIGSDNVEDAFNDFDMNYNIQSQNLGYVIVEVQRNGETQYYIFTGPGGSLTAVADDFFLFEGSMGELDNFEYEWDGTSLRLRKSNGQWGPWVDLQGPQGDDALFEYEWSGTRLRIRNSDGTWGPWVDLGAQGGAASGSVLYFDYFKGSTPSTPQQGQVWYIESPTALFMRYDQGTWVNMQLTLDNMLFVYKATRALFYWNSTTNLIELLNTGGGGSGDLTEWENISLTPSTQIHIDESTPHSHNLTPVDTAWSGIGQNPFFRGFIGDNGGMRDGIVGYIRNGSLPGGSNVKLVHNDGSIGIPLYISSRVNLDLAPEEIVWWKYSNERERCEITAFATLDSILPVNDQDDIYTLTPSHIVGDLVRVNLTYPSKGLIYMSAYINGQFVTPTDMQLENNNQRLVIIGSNVDYEIVPGDLLVVRYKY